jgi:hypothetical protein
VVSYCIERQGERRQLREARGLRGGNFLERKVFGKMGKIQMKI